MFLISIARRFEEFASKDIRLSSGSSEEIQLEAKEVAFSSKLNKSIWKLSESARVAASDNTQHYIGWEVIFQKHPKSQFPFCSEVKRANMIQSETTAVGKVPLAV
jgi:hypothetical protein